jgi:hypothetical protein
MRPPLFDRPATGAIGQLTLLALLPRLVAALFSGGYFAHDDHFLVVEAARSWADGEDYNNWLPWNQGADPRPSGHSFFYVGLHFILFKLLLAMGIDDPADGMVVVRILHALWSLLVVRLGYRIALRLSDPEIAWRTGLFLALLGFMPFLSVRNLVEVACIPFVMAGAWELVRRPEGPAARNALMAGVWLGMAMNVRFQTIFFAAGPGLALLFQRRWPAMLAYGGGLLIPLVLIQGGLDLFVWGRPFAELAEYVGYNLVNTTTYGVQPWYNYVLLLAGLFIPPFSLFVLWGFARRPAHLLVWLPVLLFVAVHSYFPNKQERFILPIVPLYFTLGHVAWERFRTASGWWRAHQRLWRGILGWTWGLSTVVLVVLSMNTSKRSRVEAMGMLLHRDDVRGWVVEDTPEHEPPMLPKYYGLQWRAAVLDVADTAMALDSAVAHLATAGLAPNYAFFIGQEDLPVRMARVEQALGPLDLVGVAEPGLVDRFVHWLNPVNRNETITVMRTKAI